MMAEKMLKEHFRYSDKAPENREKLLAAMRSGKYTQISGKYRHLSPGFCGLCVMGLILDLFAPETWEVFDDDNGYFPEFPYRKFYDVYCALGLTANGAKHLVELNDENIMTFPDIADEIEACPADFFAKGTI